MSDERIDRSAALRPWDTRLDGLSPEMRKLHEELCSCIAVIAIERGASIEGLPKFLESLKYGTEPFETFARKRGLTIDRRWLTPSSLPPDRSSC